MKMLQERKAINSGSVLSDTYSFQAVKVLKNMSEGTKLIGIISHVTELKQEIDDKLVVTKTDRGSKVRWELG